MKPETKEITRLIHETVRQFVNETATILDIESTPLKLGYQAVGLSRHKVLIESHGRQEYISLITKLANRAERRVMHRLYAQKANVPFSRTQHMDSDQRALLCIQVVDDKTDYGNLDTGMLQQQEIRALAYIHSRNHGLHEELSWLPRVNRGYIEGMIYGLWKPVWEEAKSHEPFIETFGTYIPGVEAAAGRIVDELEAVLNEEASYTLIHNDLNPGNVLVYDNHDVMFIDWEEARYGPLFLDIPMRFDWPQAREYREVLVSLGWELPVEWFEQMYRIASRYLGLRYMVWNLGVWTSDANAKEGLRRYLEMASSYREIRIE